MANYPSLLQENFTTNPFREFVRYQNRMERLMNELLDLQGQERTLSEGLAPSSELIEEDKDYLLKVDLPGIKKEDVKIEVVGDRVTVRAERKSEKEEKHKRRHVSEISYGSYVRTFLLPQPIDEKKVDAKFENGVLVVTIPKTEETKPKQISIH